METTGTPAQSGLFSTLTSHESARPSGGGSELNQGVRPRLPSRFEALDLNLVIPPLEEQIERATPRPAESSYEKPAVETGPPPVAHPGLTGEFGSRPVYVPHQRVPPLREEPWTSPGPRPVEDQLIGNHPLDRGIRVSNSLEKSSPGSHGLGMPTPDPASPFRSMERPAVKTIVETRNTVASEATQQATRPVGSSKRAAEQLGGLAPRFNVTQPLSNQAMETPREPVIEIHIGRIEVRAQIQAAPTKPARTPAATTDNGSLQLYLRSRARGARS